MTWTVISYIKMVGDNMIFTPTEKFQVPIPVIFHSFERDALFAECVVCGRQLLEDGVSYFIEKAYRDSEVIFEYSICDECRGTANDWISFDSMTNIGSYLFDNMDAFNKRGDLLSDFDNSVKPWLDSCFFTETGRSACDNYQICAECEGGNLVVSFLPMMISEEAAEIFQSLMSKQTRDSFGDFTREKLNPPVDFHDIPMLV